MRTWHVQRTGTRGRAMSTALTPILRSNARPGFPASDLLLAATLSSLIAMTLAAADHAPAAPKVVREPAVAGLFYPGDREALSRAIDQYLAAAKPDPVPNLKALICPHAGYEYSGPVSGFAYKLLVGRPFRTVIVMAPSHYAMLQGAAVSRADVFRTPLGDVPISDQARALAKLRPFVPESPTLVQRPAWAAQSPRKAPATGEDTADTWEHSDEVQVPFLQKTLRDFKLLPVVFGEVDPERAARVLAGLIDDQTLIVASSDLSHYHPYAEARELDTRCVNAVCAFDIEAMKAQEACGKTPILTLMHLATLKGWQAKRLDYRNSGDTAGDKSRVVGYAAIAFYAPAEETFSDTERKQLLELARATLQEVVTRGRLPEVSTNGWPASFFQPKGCFVTLTKRGELRGCIGHLAAIEPLYRAVMDNARNAALRDARFLPVKPEELAEIEVEVSVLTEPKPLPFRSPEDLLARLRPHEDGVILTIDGHTATFLPQVWEQIPDKAEFLGHLSRKAGCEPSAWRKPGTTVSIYHVEAFKETK
jgi:MEMO1 family protein